MKPRALFIAALVGTLFYAMAGCANPNDPRFNPKMQHWMQQRVMGELNASGYSVTPRDYRIFRYEWRNPETRRREVLTLFERQPGVDAPTGFVYAYDLDLSHHSGLRSSITSVENHWSPPPRHPASAPAAPSVTQSKNKQ